MKKIYLAIPYSGIQESSYEQANKATAELMSGDKGVNVFSPITHSHPLTKHGVRGDWEFWKKIDFQFIASMTPGRRRSWNCFGLRARIVVPPWCSHSVGAPDLRDFLMQ